MKRKRSQKRIRRGYAALGLTLGLMLGAAPNVWAWGTPEHIMFGEQIADPFEDVFLGEDVPVFVCKPGADTCEVDVGPKTFGDWVSAPDFGRSLGAFLFNKSNTGPVACAQTWAAEGLLVDGEHLNDQSLADGAAGTSLADKAGIVDCADGWAVNNNHFGDFAANQYVYYHFQALEAARRYRRTRNDACRRAAYTLEGWGQHYLTDSTASGHGWNPPGSYDAGGALNWVTGTALNVVTGPGVRMRIHNHFNENGAVMVAPVIEGEQAHGHRLGDELWWGDNSQDHTHDGQNIPNQSDANVQKQVTMRLARIGLGQVVSTAECGVRSDELSSVFHTDDERGDPRRVYASDASMCKVLLGREIWDNEGLTAFIPDGVKLAGLDSPELRAIQEQCAADNGNLSVDPDNFFLAAAFFADKFSRPGEGAVVSIARDPKSTIDLDDLGCFDVAEAAPIAEATDLCGNALCEIPAGAEGECPEGMGFVGGCCNPRDKSFGSGGVEATAFGFVEGGSESLRTPGSVSGEAPEFLWFKSSPIDTANARGEFSKLSELGEQTLKGRDENIAECGKQGSFSSFEARVRGDFGDKAVWLNVNGMDEGAKIQVNGHVVAHLDRTHVNGPRKIQLVTNIVPPMDDGSHYVRVTNLNSCGDEVPVKLSLELADPDDKADGSGGDRGGDGGGCNVGGDGSAAAIALFLLGLWVARPRRRRLPGSTRPSNKSTQALISVVGLLSFASLAACASSQGGDICQQAIDVVEECTGVAPEYPAEGCVSQFADAAEDIVEGGCDAVNGNSKSDFICELGNLFGLCEPVALEEAGAKIELEEACPPSRDDELCQALRANDFVRARDAAKQLRATTAGVNADLALHYYISERVVSLVVWNKLTQRGTSAAPADYASAANSAIGEHYPAYGSGDFAMARQEMAPLGSTECTSNLAIVYFPGVVRGATEEGYQRQFDDIASRFPCLQNIRVDTGNFIHPTVNAQTAKEQLAALHPQTRYLMIGYSQGSANALRTLTDMPEIAERTITVLTMNSAARGSEVGDTLFRALDATADRCGDMPAFAQPACESLADGTRSIVDEIAASMAIPVDVSANLQGHLAGVRSLTTIEAEEFWSGHAAALPKHVLYTSFRSVITDTDRNLPRSNGLFFRLLERAGAQIPYNDMQVLLPKQSLGGPVADIEVVLPVAEGNHWQWMLNTTDVDSNLMPADMSARTPQSGMALAYFQVLFEIGVIQ